METILKNKLLLLLFGALWQSKPVEIENKRSLIIILFWLTNCLHSYGQPEEQTYAIGQEPCLAKY